MRENAQFKGYQGKKAICGCCNVNEVYTSTAEKIVAHNGYGYMCEECIKRGVDSSNGIFTPKKFNERRPYKEASHGVSVSFEMVVNENEKNLRMYLLHNYEVARIGNLFVSTSKKQTCQLSKLSDYIRKEYGKELTATASKDGYTLKGSVDLIIKAVRDISSNHGKLSERIIKEYGFKKA